MIVREVFSDPFAVAARLSPPALILDARSGLSSPGPSRACGLWPAVRELYPHALAPAEGVWVWRTPRGGWLVLWDASLPPMEAADSLSILATMEDAPLRVALELPVIADRGALVTALRLSTVPLHVLAATGE